MFCYMNSFWKLYIVRKSLQLEKCYYEIMKDSFSFKENDYKSFILVCKDSPVQNHFELLI